MKKHTTRNFGTLQSDERKQEKKNDEMLA